MNGLHRIIRVALMLGSLLGGRQVLADEREREVAVQINQANELLRGGDVDGAVKAYRQLQDGASDRADLSYNLAVAQYRKGAMAAAEGLFNQAAAANDDALAAKARYNLGNCNYASALQMAETDRPAAIKSLEKAIENYRRALEIDSNDADSRANIELAASMIDKLREKDKKQQQQQKQQQQKQQQQKQQDQKQQDQKQQDQKQQDQKQQEQKQQEQKQQEQKQQSSDQKQQKQENNKKENQEKKDSQQQQGKDKEQSQQEQQQKPDSAQEKKSQEGSQDQQQKKDDNSKNQSPKKTEPQSQPQKSQSQEHKSEQKDSKSQSPDSKSQLQEQSNANPNDQKQQTASQNQSPAPSKQKPKDQRPEQGESKQPEPAKDQQGSAAPKGALSAADQKAGKADPQGKELAEEPEDVPEGAMTTQEAEKMLQAIRDQEMIRRLKRQAAERNQHVPVDRDW